ncbi:MAG TPA: hypothetical protein VGO40_03925 [Longimicrobium sp.]|jgi:hypothetical protein|nr:hypothetical protein [Longimicrobium sp.]
MPLVPASAASDLPQSSASMSNTKLAVTWADLLLLAILCTIGAGVCALSARVAGAAMDDRVPKEAAFLDSAGLPRLELALAAAGEERMALHAQLRELRLRQLRDSSALALVDEDAAVIGTARQPVPPGAADSLARERARVLRSLRTDSALAVRLRAEEAHAGDTVTARHRTVSATRKHAGDRYGAARRHFTEERTLWTAGGALAAVTLLMVATAWGLRRRTSAGSPVHATRVIVTASATTVVILVYQLLGAPFTLLLAALAALIALLVVLKHAS